MKKIGIITHYFNSKNYGGNLQAYALCKLLDKNGFDAEQISYNSKWYNDKQKTENERKSKPVIKIIRLCKRLIKTPLRAVRKLVNIQKFRTVRKRYDAISAFNNSIPHTNTIYNEENICETANNYDVFITGSDQVWNIEWYYPAYFLSFVDGGKRKKLAYAASMAMSEITPKQKEIIKEHLCDFSAISVREEKSVDLLKEIAPAEIALDPTLLLDKNDWEKVEKICPVNKKYIFCYFLGNNKQAMKLAKEYAKKHGLITVSIAYLRSVYDKLDKGIIDKQVGVVSPEQFLSLIKNAEYVFTDSFHAVVFSNVFERQYFVFNRDEKGSMNSRIFNITELFNSTDRFSFNSERENLEYISSLPNIDYGIENKKFQEMKEKSIRFLLENVK